MNYITELVRNDVKQKLRNLQSFMLYLSYPDLDKAMAYYDRLPGVIYLREHSPELAKEMREEAFECLKGQLFIKTNH